MTTPTPNTPLTAEDVTLLKGGDLLLDRAGRVGRFESAAGDYIWARIGEGATTGAPSAHFTFIGRLSEDGWIPAPEGGWAENPVPGQRVDYQVSNGHEGHDWHSGNLRWDDDENHIIAFRLASLSPAASEDVAEPDRAEGGEGLADVGREAIWKVVHELWQLLDDGETGADGTVTIDQARYQEVSKAMDDLEALVPDDAGPFWGGFPVNYFWRLK